MQSVWQSSSVQSVRQCAEGGREGSVGLAPVGGGVGFCIFTSVRKVEARFCAARTFLCFLVRDPGLFYRRGGRGERERPAEEVIVGRGFLSEVTWGGCRSYSPLISLMSAHSHLAGAPYAVCRQQRRRRMPPTCRLARPPTALGFTPAPTPVDKGGISRGAFRPDREPSFFQSHSALSYGM